MRNNNQELQSIKEIVQIIKGEKIEELNFDNLVKQLESLASEKNDKSKLETELDLLRSDYIGRISGMLKAIGAVKNKKEEIQEILDYLEELPKNNSEELCRIYRTIQSKFRSNFPASFGQIEFIK